MSSVSSGRLLRANELLGQAVYSANGKKIGRVRDLLAERSGDYLCVTALCLGTGAWLNRFGWAKGKHGWEVSLDHVATLTPRITLRTDAGNKG